jgi:hypothetical protein
MLGVVNDAPAAVFSVTATNHADRSVYWLHGPSSCREKEKSQSVPRWIVEDVWTATMSTKKGFSQVIPCRVAATGHWLRPLGPRLGGDLIGSAGEFIQRAGRSLAEDLKPRHAAGALVAA